MHNGLREAIRLAEGRAAEPSAAILDSQSLRAADTVAAANRGYDAGNYAGVAVMPTRPPRLTSRAAAGGTGRHNQWAAG